MQQKENIVSLVRLLPAWLHAVADYAVGLSLIVVAIAVGGSGAAVATGVVVGATVLLVSALTRYPLGVAKVLPFTVHSAGDYWHTMPGASGPTVEADEAVVGILDRTLDEATQRSLGQLDPLPVEAGLIPLYYALNLLEGVYRGGHIDPELHAISRTGEIRVPPMLVDDVIEVLAHQSSALQQLEGYAITRGRLDALPAASYGHAAPLLVPNWAEGDLLIGPLDVDGGYSLLDVKTVTRVTPHHVLQWLRQTLAYALLDTAHRWQIARFGLWLPRQSWIVTIPLDEGINALGGRRTEFLRLAKQAIELDGGDPAVLLAATP